MNYTELKAAIQDWVEYTEAGFVANLDTIIQKAENRIHHTAHFLALRKNATTSLTASDRFLAMPSDFLAPYSLSVFASSIAYPVDKKDPSFLMETFSNTEGRPRYYGMYDQNTAILGPIPDQAYSAELHYFYEPESIVTATTTWLGDNAHHLLLQACILEAYIYMKGEADIIQTYKDEYQQAMIDIAGLGMTTESVDHFRKLFRMPRQGAAA